MRRSLILAIIVLTFPCLVVTSVRGRTDWEQSSETSFSRAVELQKSGDLEGAIRAYNEFLKQHPQSIEGHSNLGAVYASLGRYAEATEEYKRALEIDGNNIPVRFNLALAYYKSAEFPKAASEFTVVAGAQPGNKNATLLLADCYLRMGENNKVIQLLSPLQESYGPDNAFLYLLGTALIRERQPEGQVLVDKILRNGDSAEAHLMLGTSELMAHDDASALKEFSRALELNPTLPSLHAFYGRGLLDTGRRDRATEAFRSELELNPNDFDSNLYLGVIMKEDNKFDDARRYFQRALEIRSQALDARYEIGSLYLEMGNLAQAQQVLEALVKEAPDFTEAHVSLATLYYRLKLKSEGDREKAKIAELNKETQAHMRSVTTAGERPESGAPSAQPIPPSGSSEGAPSSEARAAVSPSRPKEEQPSPPPKLGAGIRGTPTFDQLANRATAAREANDDRGAIDLYRQALEVNDSWPEGWWYLGTLYYDEDRYKEGRDAFARLALLEPKGGAGLAMLGLCEFRLREYGAALEHLQHAHSLGLPAHDELTRVVLYHLGLLLNRSGQPEAALQVLFALAREQSESPQILEALGLAGLDVPSLPSELLPGSREMVLQAGRVEYRIGIRKMPEARAECEKLVAAYSDRRNVHYIYGIILLDDNPDAALGEFQREFQISPGSVRARLQIAFEYLRRGDYNSGLPYAEQSVSLAPKLPGSHYALGRFLFKLGKNDQAIAELEESAKLAPDSPEVHYALFDAYARVHRKSDALRERQTFADLQKKQAQQGGPAPLP